jgi:tetratricopeptide (TPR) repeat protein
MSNHRSPVETACVILILLAGFSATAPAQQTQPWAGPAFQAPAAALLESAKAIEKTKGYDTTLFMDEVAVSVDEAGRTKQRYRFVFRVEGAEGLESWAIVSVFWDPWHQKQPEVRARVVTPNGVEHVLDPKTLSDAPAHQDGTEVYSDRRVYRGPLPAMAVGAVVEEEVLLEDTEPVYPGGAGSRLYVARSIPSLRTRISIEAPVAVKLKYEVRLLPDAKVTKVEENGISRVTVDQGKLDPIEVADTNLPPELPVWPQVEFSTSTSWKEVAHTYREMSEPQIRVGQVAQIVRETIDPKDSREEKIRKLTARLHKDVRYTGIEFGRLNIVPQPPEEVFKRKYGDCKDKAATLVAMLRAADVPAYLVLLNAGTGHDVTPSLPGGNLFTHAIVLAPGKPDIWIDATDQYSAPGHLPMGDQGRYALVIREETKDLVRTPATTGIDNLLVEKREYRLAEFGPATVIEESETHGFTDRNYRSYYGSALDSKKLQKGLEDYTKSNYLADGETKVEIGEGLDLSKPFVVRIEALKAGRGYTSLRDARASIFLASIAANLPDYFGRSDEDIKKEDDRREKPRTPRTADFVLAPFITEWQCKFVPPPGFKLRSMPENKTENLGPAKLTQRWEAAADGRVTGTIRFDTVKGRYTAAEAEALRKAIGEFRKANALTVAYDEEGYSLLAAGKGKEAIAAFDALIKLHPAEALHRIQMGSALLGVGLGESARKQLYGAVRLEPKSAMAHSNLAWVLQHDLVGRRFKKGFDLEGALAEYRMALEIDPEDNDTRGNYAALLGYHAAGERLSEKANLAEAIVQYRKLKEKKYAPDHLNRNLSLTLFWAGRWKEVEALVGGLQATNEYNAMLIAARTALEGTQAGIRRAAELTSDEKAKAEALVAAGNNLLGATHYQEGADLLAAANTGDASLETITAVRNTHKYEESPPPPNTAVGTVKKMLTYLLGPPTPDPRVVGLCAREWKVDGKEGPIDLDVMRRLGLEIRYQAGAQFATYVQGDIILSNIKLSAEGDDKLGYRVMLQMMELNGMATYVIKTADGYRIIADGNSGLARVALTKVEEDDLNGARQWLDWAREEVSVKGGEDPLAGPVFARVWRRGQKGDKVAIQVAAAALLSSHKQVEPLLPVLKAARDKATMQTDMTNLDLILFDVYTTLERWSEALSTMEGVLRAYPDSDRAFDGYQFAARKLRNWEALESAARQRLERSPDDERAIVSQAMAATAQGNFAKSLELLRTQISNPKAQIDLLNNYAWNGLFVSPAPSDMVDIGQRAAQLTNNRNFSVLHTLASVCAEIGRPAEARKLILAAMDRIDLEEPNEAAWYVFGRIAEQYGQMDAALAAYRRVKPKKPEDPLDNDSAWALARRRAKLMGVSLD